MHTNCPDPLAGLLHAPIGAASSFATASKGKSQLCGQQYARAHQNDAERVVGWNFEHGVKRRLLVRLGPRGVLGYAIQRGTPGSESIQSAVTLSSFEIKVTGSRDVSIAAVSPARVAWRYRWVKGKAPVGGPGLHFLEDAFLHGALGGHPPSFSFDINFNARHLASFRGAQEFFRRQRGGSPRRIAKMRSSTTSFIASTPN